MKKKGGRVCNWARPKLNKTHTIQEWMLCEKKFTGLIIMIMMDVFKQPPLKGQGGGGGGGYKPPQKAKFSIEKHIPQQHSGGGGERYEYEF